jgi:hypothetical protein
MQAGIHSGFGSEVGVVDGVYGSTGGVADVVIDNPSGSNFYGALIDYSSTLFVSSAKLRVLNAGQPWGADTGGIKISGASSLYASANMIISGSHGQGIYVNGNSHADLDGSSITGSQHGGLVAVNLGTIDTISPAPVSGNAVDVFCDSQSLITGGANIVNASTIQCTNLLPGASVAVP